jgi:hypothetical protein
MQCVPCGRLVAAIVTALVLATSCGGGGEEAAGAERSTTDDTPTTTSSTTTTVAPGPFAPYTGVEVGDRPELLEQPAMVVKIGNNKFDRASESLTGIEAADVVIEERIEANATRFFAIFHSELPDEVGSVRSGRTTDVALLSALGNPLLVYSGANGGVQGQLSRAATQGKVVLVVDDGRGVNLYRDSEYRAPSNLFADPAFLLGKFGDRSGPPTPLVSFLTPGSAPRPPGEPASGATVSSEYEVSFVYVPGTGYVRLQDGEIQATSDGVPIVVDNVVIMETRYEQSRIYADSVDAITTAWGRATVLAGGEMWVGTWERPERTDQYRIIHPDGSEIMLDPGKTWISLALADTYGFEIDSEIAEVAAAVDG